MDELPADDSRRFSGTYLVVGPPGTGKTTWLARQVREIVAWSRENGARQAMYEHPVIVCSLTRAAAAEAAGRDLPIARHAVGTLHSHCYRALGCPKLAVGEALRPWSEEHPALALELDGPGGGDDGAADRIEITLERRDDQSRAPGLDLLERSDRLRHRCAERSAWPASIAAFSDKWEAWKAGAGVLDFTDLIERCLADDVAPVLQPRVLLVDEAQDLSRLEYRLVRRWGERCGCLMVVGDPWQALYEWRGADPSLFADPSVPASHRRVLGRSYRVCRAVRDFAVAWAARLSDHRPIEYAPTEVQGELSLIDSRWRAPERAVDFAEREIAAGRSVIVQASSSYMLAPLVAVLKKRALPFSNPWRRIRGDWNPLGGSRGTSMGDRLVALARPCDAEFGDDARLWSLDDLWAWASVLRAQAGDVFAPGGKSKLERAVAEAGKDADAPLSRLSQAEGFFADGVLVMLAGMLSDVRSPADCAPVVRWWAERVMPSKQPQSVYPAAVAVARGFSALVRPPQLHIGTIHSFKGAEADTVVLFPDLSPAAYSEWARGGPSADPVTRLMYVAYTRARTRLVLAEPCSGLHPGCNVLAAQHGARAV